MRQLFIAGNVAYPTAATDYTKVAAGAIAVFDNSGKLLKTTIKDAKDYVSIVLGRGADKQALVMDMVDLNGLTVVKSEYRVATTFTAKVTIPTTKAGKDYTVIVTKKGMVFNERHNWSSTLRAKESDTATTVADKLVKAVNANTINSGMKASNAAGVITFTAVKAGTDYNITCADELIDVKPTAVTAGIAGLNDPAYIKDLASQAAAGKGFEYTAQYDKDIYPGYPEQVLDANYTVYTLTFAKSSKSRTIDFDKVNQILQIAVPAVAAQVATLDTILGLTVTTP